VPVTPARESAALTGKQRSFLRALAHPLRPLVQIGHGGLTDAVVIAIDGALQTHELVKVKITGNDEVKAADLAPQLEQRTRSSIAQVIGKTVVLYRGRKKEPGIVLPTAGKAGKASTPSKVSTPSKPSRPSRASRPNRPSKPSKPGRPSRPSK
jgi:RNA-binding protein